MRRLAALLLTAATTATITACGGDSKDKTNTVDAGPPTVSPEAYRKAQQAFADSVLNASRTTTALVQKLGKDYAVGSVRLRDSLALLSAKSGCFAKARESDPYLAGTVSYFVFMSVIGSTVVNVQESQWTSQAGNIVDSCLNLAAKSWKFNETFGKPAAYITQVQFKQEQPK